MNPLEKAALAYARRGLRVHPVVPGGKLPILKEWQIKATVDPALITKWWGIYPSANIGVATGGPERLLVVDIDPDTGGEASWAQLESEHGFPATVEAVTPRSGRHLYLKVPPERPVPGNSAGRLGKGIDIPEAGGDSL